MTAQGGIGRGVGGSIAVTQSSTPLAVASLTWSGDLSTNRYTGWAFRPYWARRACIRYTWTNTDTPVGTFGIEVDNACAAGQAGDAYTPAPTQQPAGTGTGSALVEIETSAAGVRLTYTAGSGGTGAAATTTITWSP